MFHEIACMILYTCTYVLPEIYQALYTLYIDSNQSPQVSEHDKKKVGTRPQTKRFAFLSEISVRV